MTHVPQPGATYIVQGALKHTRATRDKNGDPIPHPFPGESSGEFKHGDTFVSNDPELLTTLHNAGAIRLPAEIEDPTVIAARQQSLESERNALSDENAALKAELARLKSAKSGRSAKALNDSKAAAEGSEEDDSSEDDDSKE